MSKTPSSSKTNSSASSGKASSGKMANAGLTVKVKTARKRTLSSQRWLERQLNDPYVRAAKKDGYRSRAAYKLLELDERFHFLKKGQTVVDLGATPGGWCQVVAKRFGLDHDSLPSAGRLIAIDIQEMTPLSGVTFKQLDFTTQEAEDWLFNTLDGKGVDVVLSDMAPFATGHKATDHIQIMALAELAVDFALKVLKRGGSFVCKVLQGGSEKEMLDLLKKNFDTVRHAKPPASRSDSSEMYVIAMGFREKNT
jgi:23S rRNA (uridine2552-2'-O)-methyltransferase